MRLRDAAKFFAWGDDFVIKDDAGNDAYEIKGKVFNFGDKLSFCDMSGRELVFIRQRLLAWGPTYELYHGDQLVAMISKHVFTLFNCKFTVDVPGKTTTRPRGISPDHNYVFIRGGRHVAEVAKQWLTMTDTYGVDIVDGENDVLLLASTVVIDMVCRRGQQAEQRLQLRLPVAAHHGSIPTVL